MEKLALHYENQQITFEKDLILGSEQIDEQHHALFRLTHAVNQLLDTTPSREEIEVRALELEAYVKEHLGFEEALLSKNGYGNFPSHKKLHDDFAQTANKMRIKMSDPSTSNFQQAARELFEILLNWLVTHIMIEDRAAKDYMGPGEHGIQPRPPRILSTEMWWWSFLG